MTEVIRGLKNPKRSFLSIVRLRLMQKNTTMDEEEKEVLLGVKRSYSSVYPKRNTLYPLIIKKR